MSGRGLAETGRTGGRRTGVRAPGPPRSQVGASSFLEGLGDLRWKLPSRKLRRARDKGDLDVGLADRRGGARRTARGCGELHTESAALRRCGAEARGAAPR